MIVVILTPNQKDLINNFEVDGNNVRPTKDGNGEYFITEKQAEMIKDYFMWVKDLPQTEYVPPKPTLPL